MGRLMITHAFFGVPCGGCRVTGLPQYYHGLMDTWYFKDCIYLESQKHKVVWSLWEKAVMIVFWYNIVFTCNEKNGQIKRTLQSYP